MSISKRIIDFVEKKELSDQKFILVTNNCWGSDIYQTLDRPYNTPFVGLYIPGESYISLLSDFRHNIRQDLTFIAHSPLLGKALPFPIALLGDSIEIHFMHYSSEDEAREKWTRRVSRLKNALDQGASLRFKFCDRDPGNAQWIEEFHQLDLEAKVSFGVNSNQFSDHIRVKPDPAGHFVPVGPRLFRKRYQHFDFCEWIKSGKVIKTPRSRILGLLR